MLVIRTGLPARPRPCLYDVQRAPYVTVAPRPFGSNMCPPSDLALRRQVHPGAEPILSPQDAAMRVFRGALAGVVRPRADREVRTA